MGVPDPARAVRGRHPNRLQHRSRGAGTEDGWRALDRTIALFRTVATEVAGRLALDYPQRLDAWMTRYLERVRTGAGADDAG